MRILTTLKTEVGWVLLITSKAGKVYSSFPWHYLQVESADSAAFPWINITPAINIKLCATIANSSMYYAHDQGEPPPTVIGKRPELLFLV